MLFLFSACPSSSNIQTEHLVIQCICSSLAIYFLSKAGGLCSQLHSVWYQGREPLMGLRMCPTEAQVTLPCFTKSLRWLRHAEDSEILLFPSTWLYKTAVYNKWRECAPPPSLQIPSLEGEASLSFKNGQTGNSVQATSQMEFEVSQLESLLLNIHVWLVLLAKACQFSL